MKTIVVGFCTLLFALPALPALAERTPVAVLWVGPPQADVQGWKLIDATHAELARSVNARPVDVASMVLQQTRSMPTSDVWMHLQVAHERFSQLKFAEAVREYQAAERIAFDTLPMAAMPLVFAEIERGLLVCYDQLNQPVDASRSAERLSWVAAADEPARAQMQKYWAPRSFDVPLPPVQIITEPAGADVFRDGQFVGKSPLAIFGGDPAVDRISVELDGFRPLRRELGWNERELHLQLAPEDRLNVRLDQIRQAGLDTPPAAVAAIGKELGAERVLAIYSDGKDTRARIFDVNRAAASAVTGVMPGEVDKLVGAIAPPVAAVAPKVVVVAPATPPPTKSKWGKWYTWVAAGGVVVLVGGLLIAQNVGSDKFTVTVKK